MSQAKRTTSLLGFVVSAGLMAGCASASDGRANDIASSSVQSSPDGQSVSVSVAPSLPAASSVSEVPMTYAPASSPVAAPISASSAAAKVLSGLDSVFSSVAVASGPTGSRPGPWLYTTFRCDSQANAGCMLGTWESDLLQGAVAELINSDSADLANVIVGSSLTAKLPDGELVDEGGGAGDVAAGQQFSDKGIDDSAIRDQVTTAVTNLNLSVQSIRVLHPLDPAVAVIAKTSTPDTAVAALAPLLNAVRGAPGQFRFEGVYIEIDGPDGTPLAKSATAYRTTAGRQWTSPTAGEGSLPHG